MASDAQRQAWRDAIAAQHKQRRRQRARPAVPQVTGVRVPAPIDSLPGPDPAGQASTRKKGHMPP